MLEQIRFGAFTLDPANERLFKGGEAVALRPKAFSLLLYLAGRPGELATKEALLDSLWAGVHVSDAVLKVAMGELRRALGDPARSPSLIQTVHRRGYRFIADVRVESSQGTLAPPDPTLPVSASDPPATPGPTRATVAEPEARSDFVGRAADLERLHSVWRSASAGRTQLVLLTGPPGIGKTRLSEEFCGQLQSAGTLVVMVRGANRDGAPSFWLWTQVLRALAEEEELREEVRALANTSELAHLLPDFPAFAPGPAPRQEAPAPEQRFYLADAVTRVIAACARIRECVLILEDLQWTSAASLRLLEHLACDLRDVPLLTMVSIRTAPRVADHPADRTERLLRQQDHCTPFALEGLALHEVEELCHRMVDRSAPRDLLVELIRRTEGVPLFVREAIRLLNERGDFERPGPWDHTDIPIARRSIDILTRSISTLSSDAQAILGAGAVLGRQFTLTQAAAIAECPRDRALDLLDEAIAAGVLSEQSSTVAGYRFAHALFREALYDGLSPGVRARLHQRTASRLESQYAGALDDVIAELAHHLHCGIAVGDSQHSFEIAIRAAELAEQQLAYEQAAIHYQQADLALEHCESGVPERRLRTLLALGSAHQLGGENAGRRRAYARAIQTARTLGDRVARARAAIGYCSISEWSPHDEVAREYLEEALAGLDEAKDAPLVERSRLTARLGYLGIVDRLHAEPLGREAVRLARGSGDTEALQEALYVLHCIIGGPDGIDQRGELIDELTDAGAACRNRDVSVIALLDVACDRLALGERRDGLAMRKRAEELAGRFPSPSTSFHLGGWDTGIALMEGRLEAVERLAAETLSIGRRIRHPYAEAVYQVQHAQMARERGDHAAVIELLGSALPGMRGAPAWAKAVVARAELARGERARGQALFDELAADDFRALPRDIRWLGSMPEVSILCAELEDVPRARILVERLRPERGRHGLFPVAMNYGGPLARAEARLREFLGDPEGALPLYADALAAAERLEAYPMCARIKLDHARVLTSTGDTEQVDSLLRESREIAGRLGLIGLLGEIEALDLGSA